LGALKGRVIRGGLRLQASDAGEGIPPRDILLFIIAGSLKKSAYLKDDRRRIFFVGYTLWRRDTYQQSIC
jgi:hypothetical protein